MVSPCGDDFFVVTNSVRPLLFICPHIRYPHNTLCISQIMQGTAPSTSRTRLPAQSCVIRATSGTLFQRTMAHRLPYGTSTQPCNTPKPRRSKRAVEGASPYSFFGQNRSARCWGTAMVSYANSSLLTPHLTGNSPFSTVASAISLISSQSCE